MCFNGTKFKLQEKYQLFFFISDVAKCMIGATQQHHACYLSTIYPILFPINGNVMVVHHIAVSKIIITLCQRDAHCALYL